MAGNRKDAIDTIIANIFRYLLFFGLTTHVYDTKKHQLVYSRRAHCYSLSLHVTLVILFPVLSIIQRHGKQPAKATNNFYQNLIALAEGIYILSIFVSIAFQWTLRANASTLFNEIIRIWQDDITHLQVSREIRRQAAGLFFLKTLTSALIVANAVFGIYLNKGNSFRTAVKVYEILLCCMFMTVVFQFCSGLVFSQYLFRVLNHNLTRVVEDIRNLRLTQRPRNAHRHKTVVLEKELSEIGRIHSQLQKWVVRFKNMYQVELLLILISFFVILVVALFFLGLLLRAGRLKKRILSSSSSNILSALDVMALFYICGELQGASDEGGQIIKDLPAQGLKDCTQLERCVEMMWFQFKCQKLRLSVYGLFDLDWSKSFAMAGAALLYIIILIQWDYDNFSK